MVGTLGVTVWYGVVVVGATAVSSGDVSSRMAKGGGYISADYYVPPRGIVATTVGFLSM